MRIYPVLAFLTVAVLAQFPVAPPGTAGTSARPAPAVVPDTTPWRSPEEQRRGFRVPPGFEVQLVAAEPNIGKPLNLAFDAQGRLWVAHTTEYPFAASDGQGTDRVTVLEDLDGDGRADRFTDVASDLNIPTGVLPLEDAALVFSIPNVYRIQKEGEGPVGQRAPLYGPFGYIDTHGMVNSLVRGFDGWVYAGHGFNNTSAVAGTDGDTVRMFSGNTFRFRTDGSRVEQTTWGRVNPFGLFVDRLGYFYSSDSHSKPIYQLIRGAEYPHFGRQPESIGFGPTMMEHLHGSTAIAGVVLYQADHFPAEFRDNFFGGNVVTNRINRNRLVWHGSTPEAIEQPDFLISDDPNFRPVDIELGPDGALYVADFYNPIIGHYEAPLGDPARDRTSGRIWRIVYTDEGVGRSATSPLRANQSTAELIELLAHPNLVVRMSAMHALVHRGSAENFVAPTVRQLLGGRRSTSEQRVHALWILHRLGQLTDGELRRAARHSDEALRVHAMRVLADRPTLATPEVTLALGALRDRSFHVRRAAVEVLGRSPNAAHLRPLLELQRAVPERDTHLLYTIRVALRDQLADPAVLQHVRAAEWRGEDMLVLAQAASGVPSPDAARFLLDHLQRADEPPDHIGHYLRQIARALPAAETEPLVGFIRREFSAAPEIQLEMFGIASAGMADRGERPSPATREWGEALALHYLDPTRVPEAPPNELNPRRIRAAAIAADLRLTAVEPMLVSLFADPAGAVGVRLAAGRALLEMAPERHLHRAGAVLGDASAPAALREQLVNPLAGSGIGSQRYLVAALDGASPRLREKVVFALAGSTAGAEELLKAVEAGTLDARTLADPTLRERLVTGKPNSVRTALDAILRHVESDEVRRGQVIAAHVAAFPGRGSAAGGAILFASYCGACHQVHGVGNPVGPELDGVGHRRAAELIEKILDPNRNVAPAFRYQTVLLNNGDVFTGLPVREQGVGITFVDREGREVTIQKQQIAERRTSPYTLMPSNFDEIIPAEQLYDLVAYLLTLR